MSIEIPNLSAILAMDKNGGIGKNNKLPWHYPEDLKWFKEKTEGKTIIMGRSTFHSILGYNNGNPLKNRHHIVLSAKLDTNLPNTEICRSTQHLIERISQGDQEYVLIGGATLYNLFLPVVNTLYLTQVNKVYDCDAFIDISKYTSKKHYVLHNQDNSDKSLNFKILRKS